MRHCGTAPVADRVGQVLADRVGQVDRLCVTGTESNVAWRSPKRTKGEGLSSN